MIPYDLHQYLAMLLFVPISLIFSTFSIFVCPPPFFMFDNLVAMSSLINSTEKRWFQVLPEHRRGFHKLIPYRFPHLLNLRGIGKSTIWARNFLSMGLCYLNLLLPHQCQWCLQLLLTHINNGTLELNETIKNPCIGTRSPKLVIKALGKPKSFWLQSISCQHMHTFSSGRVVTLQGTRYVFCTSAQTLQHYLMPQMSASSHLYTLVHSWNISYSTLIHGFRFSFFI